MPAALIICSLIRAKITSQTFSFENGMKAIVFGLGDVKNAGFCLERIKIFKSHTASFVSGLYPSGDYTNSAGEEALEILRQW